MLFKRRKLRVGIGGCAPFLVAAAIVVASDAPAEALPCIPRTDGNPICVTTDINALLDQAEESAANVGDIPEHEAPDPETCWEAASDPAYYAMDGTVHPTSVAEM